VIREQQLLTILINKFSIGSDGKTEIDLQRAQLPTPFVVGELVDGRTDSCRILARVHGLFGAGWLRRQHAIGVKNSSEHE